MILDTSSGRISSLMQLLPDAIIYFALLNPSLDPEASSMQSTDSSSKERKTPFMLPEYINWESGYQTAINTVEMEMESKWQQLKFLEKFFFFNRHRISQMNVFLHTQKKITEYSCFKS